MLVNRVKIKNWRNFRSAEVPLRARQFIVGPNASGKSNFLDVFRFLRDIAKFEGGGIQKAIKDRGGVSKIRSLAARNDPEISIEVSLAPSPDEEPVWKYSLGIRQEPHGRRQTILTHERAWKSGKLVCDRPDAQDKLDKARLTQTSLEQINANAAFRELAEHLQSTTYLHLVPQLLRFADVIQGNVLENDPFGQGFLERVARTPANKRNARLKKIERALRVAVPQLEQLGFVKDDATGRPHLQALYSHWRPNAGWQQEDQFSDGTIRLIGLLWALLDGDSMLLLEEPELSLNSAIVSQLAPLIHRMQRDRQRQRQVLISTHSDALLSEKGIDGREVILLTPRKEGTEACVATDNREIRLLLQSGLSVSDVVMPRTDALNARQLSLFDQA